MFQKVKWKLTLTNIVVIGMILVLFSVAIVWGSPRNEASTMYELWQTVIQEGPVHNNSKRLFSHNSRNDLIYLQLNTSGEITKEVYPGEYTDLQVKQMIKTVQDSGQYNGEIETESGNFYYLKAVLDPQRGTTFVFKPQLSSSETLQAYMAKSFPLIVVTLLLVLIGSLILSGRALIPVKKAWRRQINFTADASHELRTPITVIQTNLELVLGEPKKTVESQRLWLENIMIENKRMAKLVDDLLTLSRVDTSAQLVMRDTFMLDAVIWEAVFLFERQAEIKGIELCCDLETDTLFYGDANRLKQLIMILLDNAIHHTDWEGRIEVQMKRKERGVEISVADTGIGMMSEHLDKIFDRFYRVDQARARNTGGSGLGLSIAKWIVDEYQGSIQVTSVPMQGTTFKIALPAVVL